jgi:hypothetical protein
VAISCANNPFSPEGLVGEICSLKPRLEALLEQFRHIIQQMGNAGDPDSLTRSGSYWRLVAYVDLPVTCSNSPYGSKFCKRILDVAWSITVNC